jgi:hypothetical protein
MDVEIGSAAPLSKSHIRGAVFKKEMAEIFSFLTSFLMFQKRNILAAFAAAALFRTILRSAGCMETHPPTGEEGCRTCALTQ